MRRLPTVLLRHETHGGCHYDWLMVDPHDPDGPLWTGRTRLSSQAWSVLRRWEVEPIDAHRRVYLRYEGPISGNRGSVVRVDEGQIVPRLWTELRIVLELRMSGCRGLVQLVRVRSNRWRAHLCPW